MKPLDEIRSIANSWEGPKSICICGHPGDGSPSAHEDDVRDRMAVMGHGACTERSCGCRKFTWMRFTAEFLEATK